MATIEIGSEGKDDQVDITADVQGAVSVEEGVCVVYCPHTTAALYINENTDGTVQADIKMILRKLVPVDAGYAHTTEGEENAAAHVKCTLLNSSLSIPVKAGELQLGRWQGIFLYDGDGPRKRKVGVVCR